MRGRGSNNVLAVVDAFSWQKLREFISNDRNFTGIFWIVVVDSERFLMHYSVSFAFLINRTLEHDCVQTKTKKIKLLTI